MVDLRLLGIWLLPWLLGLVNGCAFGPIYAPRLQGHVTDSRDGKPVQGALIVSYYTYQQVQEWDVRWTQTDGNGRFEIPGHFAMIWGLRTFLADTGGPEVLIAHPSYGKHFRGEADRGQWDDVQDLALRIEPQDWRRAYRENSFTVCGGFEGNLCDEICEVMWGRLCKERTR